MFFCDLWIHYHKKIIQEINSNSFTFTVFYKNRASRLTPALIATVALTSLVYSAILPPPLFDELQSAILPALLSFANIYFFFTTDYFTPNNNSPLLHTWSLSLEEQFYLVFPVILWLVRDWTKKR